MSEIDDRKLTWAALLGRWVELARAAVALPDDAEGRAWRASIPHIISLQAVTMALGEAGELDADERALGIDRAHILIDRAREGLTEAFGDRASHPMVRELLDDAAAALEKAQAIDGDSMDTMSP